MNEGVSFSDYLQPKEHSFFVDTAAFHTADLAASICLSYTYDDAVLASKARLAHDAPFSPISI